MFNVASEIERLAVGRSYGGRSLHEQSHGESFLAVVRHRFGDEGLYLLDEPEAALSLNGSLALLRAMHDLVAGGSQFIVATHSPVLMGYPGATIYRLDDEGAETIAWEDTEQVTVTRSFLENRDGFLRHLLADE